MKKEKRKGVNQWQEVLNILLHNPNAIIGFVIVAVLIILAILAPWISPYNYLEMNLAIAKQGPSAAATIMESSMPGMAASTSIIRIKRLSTHPPK